MHIKFDLNYFNEIYYAFTSENIVKHQLGIMKAIELYDSFYEWYSNNFTQHMGISVKRLLSYIARDYGISKHGIYYGGYIKKLATIQYWQCSAKERVIMGLDHLSEDCFLCEMSRIFSNHNKNLLENKVTIIRVAEQYFPMRINFNNYYSAGILKYILEIEKKDNIIKVKSFYSKIAKQVRKIQEKQETENERIYNNSLSWEEKIIQESTSAPKPIQGQIQLRISEPVPVPSQRPVQDPKQEQTFLPVSKPIQDPREEQTSLLVPSPVPVPVFGSTQSSLPIKRSITHSQIKDTFINDVIAIYSESSLQSPIDLTDDVCGQKQCRDEYYTSENINHKRFKLQIFDATKDIIEKYYSQLKIDNLL